MNCDDRKRIHGNWHALIDNINSVVRDVCDRLLAGEVIDDEEYDDIVNLDKTKKERVRSLLRTLMKKSNPNVLTVFCAVLIEINYQYLAESIRDTDVLSVEDADVVDARNNPSSKQDALVDTVLRQSDELMKLNEKYRQQIAELTERNKILERRNSCVNALADSGLTEKCLLQFVDVFVLAKNVEIVEKHNVLVRGANGSFPYPDILRKMSSETLPPDQLKACLLSICIVQHVVEAKCRYELPDSFQHYSSKLRSIVDAEMKAHPDLFNNAMQNVHIVEINGLNTFDAVADELFLDGVCNWGRVIAWFAFCASLAKKFPDTTSPDTLDLYAVFSWYYINSRMCNWIAEAGGWDEFLEFLCPSSTFRKFVKLAMELLPFLWRYYP